MPCSLSKLVEIDQRAYGLDGVAFGRQCPGQVFDRPAAITPVKHDALVGHVEPKRPPAHGCYPVIQVLRAAGAVQGLPQRVVRSEKPPC